MANTGQRLLALVMEQRDRFTQKFTQQEKKDATKEADGNTVTVRQQTQIKSTERESRDRSMTQEIGKLVIYDATPFVTFFRWDTHKQNS